MDLTRPSIVLKNFKQNLPGKGNFNPSHSYNFDTRDIKRCPESEEGLQVIRTTPEGQHRGNPVTADSKTDSSEAQIKCCYGNTLTTGSKQENLETHVHLQGCHLTDIMEPWWNGSYDWNGWIQALEEEQAGNMRKQCCPLYQCTDGVHGAPPGDG